MSLVTTKDLMLDAQKNHYAIGALNAENMEMVQAFIFSSVRLKMLILNLPPNGHGKTFF